MEGKKSERQTRIEWSLVLQKGEENAISSAELTRRLGFKDKRDTRRAVSEARLAGIPVCSLQRSEKAHGGYFLADHEKMEEVEHVCSELKKRAYTSLRQVAELNKWIKANTGRENRFEQLSISEFLKEAERL